MNSNDIDKLKNLFRQIELKEPSSEFEQKLMFEVHQLAHKERIRLIIKKRLVIAVSILCGIASIIILPSLVFHFTGWSLQANLSDIKSLFPEKLPYLQFDPMIICVSVIALMLLISDTLIRKKINQNKHK